MDNSASINRAEVSASSPSFFISVDEFQFISVKSEGLSLHTLKMAKTLCILLVLVALAAVCIAQARYPAGVNPASCPNYPFCNTAGHGAPLGYRFDNRHPYPPGVDASTCPFYPYC